MPILGCLTGIHEDLSLAKSSSALPRLGLRGLHRQDLTPTTGLFLLDAFHSGTRFYASRSGLKGWRGEPSALLYAGSPCSHNSCWLHTGSWTGPGPSQQLQKLCWAGPPE